MRAASQLCFPWQLSGTLGPLLPVQNRSPLFHQASPSRTPAALEARDLALAPGPLMAVAADICIAANPSSACPGRLRSVLREARGRGWACGGDSLVPVFPDPGSGMTGKEVAGTWVTWVPTAVLPAPASAWLGCPVGPARAPPPGGTIGQPEPTWHGPRSGA